MLPPWQKAALATAYLEDNYCQQEEEEYKVKDDVEALKNSLIFDMYLLRVEFFLPLCQNSYFEVLTLSTLESDLISR